MLLAAAVVAAAITTGSGLNLPGFEVSEVQHLAVFVETTAAQVKSYLHFIAHFVGFYEAGFVLGQLKFNVLRILAVLNFEHEFALAEFLAYLLLVKDFVQPAGYVVCHKNWVFWNCKIEHQTYEKKHERPASRSLRLPLLASFSDYFFSNMFALAIHGGAGTIARASLTPADEQHYRAALEAALTLGYDQLRDGGAALDAVEAAVRSLEDCPLFNAGRGAVFTHDGHHEMDAAIMAGHTQLAGAVAGVRQVQNPIRAARLVMEKTEHVLLGYPGADDLAREHGLPLQPAEYFFTQKRYDQLQDAIASGKMQLDHVADPNWKKGTVGAVARDVHGHLAAATSTGGMTNKRYSRIGDTPLIGAGTWADARCAISCTGNGEFFIRAVAAYDVACLMEYKGLSLAEAARVVVQDKLAPVGGEGGLIAVDAAGKVTLPFNSEGMYRASRTAGGTAEVAIYK